MTETLLHFIMMRLDQVRHPIFHHSELACYPCEDFSVLERMGVVRETSMATEIPRPNHVVPGGDLVVRHTSSGIFGVADEDDYFDPIPLTEDDIRQYEVSLPNLVSLIRETAGITGKGYDNHERLIVLGERILEKAEPVCVYLLLPLITNKHLEESCGYLAQAVQSSPSLVLTARKTVVGPERRNYLDRSGIIVDHLQTDERTPGFIVDWHAVSLKASRVSMDTGSNERIISQGPYHTLQRREKQDGVIWIVDGESKGTLYKREGARKAKILNILYNLLGQGWVRHDIFINACGWSKEEYYRTDDDPGCMQRQLTLIRKFLGLEIEYHHEKGVRFAKDVVKST